MSAPRRRLAVSAVVVAIAGTGALALNPSDGRHPDEGLAARVIPASQGGEGRRGVGACADAGQRSRPSRSATAASPNAVAPRGGSIELAPGVRVTTLRHVDVRLPCGERHPGTEIALSNGEVVRFPGMARVVSDVGQLRYCYLPWDLEECEGRGTA